MEVLNPTLYMALKSYFNQVKVTGNGTRATISRVKYGKGTRINVHGGEYYRVNCPYCHDTEFKLWISYLLGTYDPVSSTQIRHTAICYRCNEPLGADVLDRVAPPFGKQVRLSNVEEVNTTIPINKVTLPEGHYVKLTELNADHPAIEYLMTRGFDIEFIDRQFGWLYCINSSEYMVSKRIVIPVYHKFDDGLHLVGCQTRAVPLLSATDKPKYWTMRGFQKSRVLYNLHNTVDCNVIVISEGVMDVAKIGACGVCMFGKSISTEQVRLLKLTCAGKHIIVMLDPDASNDAKKIVNALTNKDPFMPDTFLSVTDAGLTDKDPGDHTTEELQAAIAKVIK